MVIMVIMQQISQVMEHLVSQEIIHRDLAEHNALVFTFYENNVRKTSAILRSTTSWCLLLTKITCIKRHCGGDRLKIIGDSHLVDECPESLWDLMNSC
jgi:hypothetical protein